MDEVLFRSSQKLENLQFKIGMTTSKIVDVVQLYNEKTRAVILELWHSARAEQLKYNVREIANFLELVSLEFKDKVKAALDPRKLYVGLIRIFGKRWTKRDVCFVCAGLIVGGLVGFSIGLAVRRKQPILRYMQAIQLNHYMGPESVSVIEDAIAPTECGDFEVLINVKAASVHIIDAQICTGYGKNLRRILRRLHNQSSSDLPVILGRECSGIVTDLGQKVKRIELGDEVWVTLPFWAQGALCQTVLVSEGLVARKPKNVGFEGACSIPYAGSLALQALEELDIDGTNARTKKILIQGGCTPVGCVLVQILRHWKCHVTATCYKRSLPVAKALGAAEVIVVSEPGGPLTDRNELDDSPTISGDLMKELEVRGERYDAIVVTRGEMGDEEELKGFVCEGGRVVNTLAKELRSDGVGVVGRMVLEVYVRMRYVLESKLGIPMPDFNEAHLCYVTLDKLTEFVEDGYIQTVVDKVFQPHDIEAALYHIQSAQSIGSTVITFR